MDRAHRIGQKKVVNVYRLISRGTLEEKIMGSVKICESGVFLSGRFERVLFGLLNLVHKLISIWVHLSRLHLASITRATYFHKTIQKSCNQVQEYCSVAPSQPCTFYLASIFSIKFWAKKTFSVHSDTTTYKPVKYDQRQILSVLHMFVPYATAIPGPCPIHEQTNVSARGYQQANWATRTFKSPRGPGACVRYPLEFLRVGEVLFHNEAWNIVCFDHLKAIRCVRK